MKENRKGAPSARAQARLALLLAAAMILSYVEHLLPAFTAIPGVKLGLANAVTLFALYLIGAPQALALSLARVLLSALLFGNAAALLYSLSGALVSFAGMVLLKRFFRFSALGVSAAGGVLHNLGQILAACLLLDSAGAFVLFPPLILSGTIAGAAVGCAAGLLIRKLSPLFPSRKEAARPGETPGVQAEPPLFSPNAEAKDEAERPQTTEKDK